jgi:endonuclease/exonuclease/phosphatase family metal-dependent hydrolase
MVRRVVASVFVCVLLNALPQSAAAQDVVLRASDFKNAHGNWAVASDSSAASGQYIASADNAQGTTDGAPATPTDYFEATFDAPAGTPYHLWVRMRADSNSKYNDSIWVQYSDALDVDGRSVYRVGTSDALDVNLERCSGCGVSGWGWQDGAYWLSSQSTTVRFASSGTHTIRVQTREDGVQIDQIVISSRAYLFESPGAFTDDTVMVPDSGTAAVAKTGTASTTAAAGTTLAAGTAAAGSTAPGMTASAAATAPAGTTTTTTASTTAAASALSTALPYLGSPISLPGHIKAENFDTGGDGVSYHDTTAGNTGGQFRQTNVDIETCSSGGYDIGWTAAGEWLNYSVQVGGAGSYTVQLRVASPSGGALHVGFNGPSNVWKTVTIPATGGWQSWTTVSVPVSLGAGGQLMTLYFDTGGLNLDYVDVVSGGSTSTPSAVSSGSSISVVTWNIQVGDSSASHAQRAIDYVMAMTPRPKVVVLQEARQSQYNTYINELQARSGQSWQGVMRTHCPAGAWNGSSCTSSEDEGVAVFSSLPVVDSGTTFLPYADSYHSARGVARLAVNVGGVVLQVFSVHLPPNNVSARAGAMSTLKSYASRFSAPQIAGGDFNADRNEIDPGMSPNFVDSWGQVGSGNGYTAFTPSPTMKIDYWFEDAGARARPEWSVVVTTAGTFSDHYAIINSFSVK